eukprot:IDg13969t1
MFGVRNGETRRPRLSTSDVVVAQRRPEGVSREVFMLTGGITPASLMPAPTLGLQSKPVAKRRWSRTPFHRTPSDTSLTLRHWAPVGQPHDAYAFARFNRPVRMLTYTDAEYDAVIADILPLNVDEAAAIAQKKRTPISTRIKATKSSTKANTRSEKIAAARKEAAAASMVTAEVVETPT